MEYHTIINFLDITRSKPFKFKAKSWVEINYRLRGSYNVNNNIKFKTSMVRSSLCDYSDAYHTYMIKEL